MNAPSPKRSKTLVRLRQAVLFAILIGLIVYWYATTDHFPRAYEGGRSEKLSDETVVYLQGTPEEMGRQHGKLLKWSARLMLDTVIGCFREGDELAELYAGVRQMEPFIPAEFVAEMKAFAQAAGVRYEDVLVANTFGDIQRTQACKSFAVCGPATRTGEMIIGRNFDFASFGIASRVATILHQRPSKGHAMVSVRWAGVCTGWTIISDAGILVANNTAGACRRSSRQGIPTLFMNRLVAQNASTVSEGIEIVRRVRRACGTNMIIAGGNPPDAVIVEFDAEGMEVRRLTDGYIAADNGFRVLGVPERHREWLLHRANRLVKLIQQHHGKIDRDLNLAAAEGAYMGCNLHSVLFFPKDMVFRVAQKGEPAARGEYKEFKILSDRLLPKRP